VVNWKQFDERQREAFAEQSAVDDMKKAMFDFPAGDPTSLLQKPMNPTDDFGGMITRDITTANLSEVESGILSTLLTSAIALNEARTTFDIIGDKEADKYMRATITCIKASAMSICATSKGKKGWLGELFVTLKRTGEISTAFVKQKAGLLG